MRSVWLNRAEQQGKEMTFWTKAAGKAESISPEAKRRKDGDGKMEEVREGAGRGGEASPTAVLHIICMVYALPGPRHANDS